ncbi:uncharacterized protein LOC763692 [Strongylocentrotus purpuratus]|uniref:MACPF domain-containing protein n=1 Tax=Strongylocentrotus purpuratus TaxID=7668 RepID=A0A7M7MZT1_STRPU|nr:uncharacterized protein LOC763692 [Strongylocentrotus purpuratus]
MFGGKKSTPVILLVILLLQDAHKCSAQRPIPSGVTFLGIGYNIIEGNPEGGDMATGGVDPGLLVSRSVFVMTYDEGKITNDGKYQIPDEVNYVLRDAAYTSSSATTFHGTSSYAEKLSSQVDVGGGYSNLFASVEFAASSRYQQIEARTDSEGYIYYANQTVSNMGNARYLTELAGPDKYTLNNGFVSTACSLPTAYAEDDYMTFLDTWGTHVVTEVDLGTREGSNYEEHRTDFVSYASTNVGGSVSSGGSYMGFSSSLSVDMDTFNAGMQSGSSFGSLYSSYRVGSASLNEPISLILVDMHEIFGEDYWTRMQDYIDSEHCTASWDRAAAAENVLTAMKGYAEWKEIQDSKNPNVMIPLTWPDGMYGLTQPDDGCPNTEFTWNEGSRYQDTEDKDGENGWSDPIHMSGHYASNMQMNFCIKTVSNVDERSKWTWQPGSYCIFKYGDSCPAAFTEGWIYWDDEDKDNKNSNSGTLPSGQFGANTRYDFCCRSDGVTDRGIFLPTDDNFYLFSQFENCQQVDGMTVSKEWFYWDTEDKSNDDDMSSVHPYQGVYSNGKNVNLNFCYYQKE